MPIVAQCFVASRWSGLGCLLFCVGLCSCVEPATETPPQPVDVSADPCFAEQAEAVRVGMSEQIRVDDQLVTDDDLRHLAGLEDKLRRINLSRTTISDAGLAKIAAMKHLRQLRLASAELTDGGMAALKNLDELEHLHLIDAPLTDVGLAHLHGLQSLHSLYLDGTQGTEAGMTALVKALPNVHLHFDGGHHRRDLRADDHQH